MNETGERSAAFHAYRDSIPKHLWKPELGEGFFKGWDAAKSSVDTEAKDD